MIPTDIDRPRHSRRGGASVGRRAWFSGLVWAIAGMMAGCGGGGGSGEMATVDEAQQKEQGAIQDKMRDLMKAKAAPKRGHR